MFVQFNIYFVALTALLLSISFNYLLLFLSQKNMLKTINKIDENRLNKNNTPPQVSELIQQWKRLYSKSLSMSTDVFQF